MFEEVDVIMTVPMIFNRAMKLQTGGQKLDAVLISVQNGVQMRMQSFR